LYVARFPEGSGDPDELIRDHPEVWESAIENRVPLFEFFFGQTMASLDRSKHSWKEEALNRLMPYIQRLSASASGEYVQRLASETQIPWRDLLRSMPSGRTPTGRSRPRSASTNTEIVQQITSYGMSIDSVESKERSLLSLLLKIVVIPDDAYEQLNDVTLLRSEHQAILQALLDWRASGNYDYEFLREEMTDEVAAYADGLRAEAVPLPQDDKLSVAVDLHLTRIHQARLDAQYRRAAKVLEDMADEDRVAAVMTLAELMNERRILDQQLEQLSVRTGQSHRA
jgi:DNA primase